jgi:hypothetical protein
MAKKSAVQAWMHSAKCISEELVTQEKGQDQHTPVPKEAKNFF